MFSIEPLGFVVFTIDLPSFFSVLKIQKYFGRNINDKIMLYFSCEGNEYIEFNQSNLEKRNHKNNEKIKIKAKNISNQLQKLTHIEITLSFSRKDMPLYKMAMGKVFVPEEFQYADIYGSADVCLSPRLNKWLTHGSIICDKKYGFYWEVTSIAQNYTTNKTLFKLDTNLRMCQREELYNLLNVYDTTYNRKGRFIS